ncbi:MAG: uracil-DNA glycosylase family protein [Rhizobiales bacterium]|nr:uracil-DNA glycosylase family protein [Hyphomicrobiales bacterium]
MNRFGSELEKVVNEISSCRICRDSPVGKPLPHEPRPVLQPSSMARILIVGQAPGTRVHASGKPFTDPSGNRLRGWLGIGPEIFYDPRRIAVLPMGFCFPGLSGTGSDLPPRMECAKAWRAPLLAAMPQIELIIALGIYALKWHMGDRYKGSLDQSVAAWREGLALSPAIIPLPHPSWRNNAWLKRNPWFETDLLPVLRREVAARL